MTAALMLEAEKKITKKIPSWFLVTLIESMPSEYPVNLDKNAVAQYNIIYYGSLPNFNNERDNPK